VKRFGAIEAGGTKFVCGVGTGPDDLVTTTIPTTTPDETLKHVTAFFEGQSVVAIGIGSFGPVDLNPSSVKYGYVTSTPKEGWRDTDLVGAVKRTLGVPVAFDTDVNAAALGESRWGAAKGARNCVYITVGTGIGGGAIVEGSLTHGGAHPEMGHMRVPHDFDADPFPGCCPFHGDCLEGLACGVAIHKRWGAAGDTLPLDHPAWRLESHYLALAVANLAFVLSPEVVILGGGVMKKDGLLGRVASEVSGLLNGYIGAPSIVAPGLGGRSGVLGALALASRLTCPNG
jgi:fructokinase